MLLLCRGERGTLDVWVQIIHLREEMITRWPEVENMHRSTLHVIQLSPHLRGPISLFSIQASQKMVQIAEKIAFAQWPPEVSVHPCLRKLKLWECNKEKSTGAKMSYKEEYLGAYEYI